MGSGGGGGSKTTTTTSLPKEGKWLWKNSGLLPLVGQGYQGYKGSVIPEWTPEMNQMQGYMSPDNWKDTFMPGRLQRNPLYGPTQEAAKGLLAGTSGAQPITKEQSQKFYQEAIQDPVMRMFQEYGLPGVSESYSGPGYWGGARANAQQEARKDVFENLSQQRVGLEWDVLGRNQQIEEAKAGRQAQVLPYMNQQEQLSASLDQMGLQNAGVISEFARQPYQYQAQKLQEMADNINRDKMPTDPDIFNALLAILGAAGRNTTTTTSGGGGGMNWGAMGGIAGLGLAALTGGLAAPITLGAGMAGPVTAGGWLTQLGGSQLGGAALASGMGSSIGSIFQGL